ncbi:lytic murein transglycosylase B [Candidatus Coxiella mudrowiae]|uniref:Membrane-bound lytic murein transglycosylase B n=1 Tax=Candidatus Coxiella mudrowiae TaxID=2054173 RepID=A0ABM5UUH1_9COXI|nr:lytic murein transglycosylase B [Candidatus Coxiella mudrowiae]AKQ33580.1 Membrane-bound lytic murein transglycosylase B [Candidatus Coxiella mudrowiae]
MLLKEFLAALYILLFSTTAIAAEPTKASQLPLKANTFINYMVKHYRFERKKLINILSHAKYNQEVIYKITHPYEAKPWKVYRDYFLTETHIQDGVNYWKAHQHALEYAHHRYGIPPEIIIAIIGIETNYAQQVGNYSALDALTTLAFHYKARAKFFLHELAQFFLLTEEQQLPIFLIKSSYAGAIGIPQFMPSAYRHYVVNYSQEGGIDLMKDNNDAIVSVANFLHTHGWQKNQPIACTLTHQKPLRSSLISKKAKKMRIINYLKNKGIDSSTPISPSQTSALVQLQGANGPEYWLIFPNFIVIMQYNPRIIYAMTVYQLSQAIHKQYDQKAS